MWYNIVGSNEGDLVDFSGQGRVTSSTTEGGNADRETVTIPETRSAEYFIGGSRYGYNKEKRRYKGKEHHKAL